MEKIDKKYLGGKRIGCLDMRTIAEEIAVSTSFASEDPSTQVGSCIVSEDDRVISTGFNHNPINWKSDEFPWRNDVDNIGLENTKYPYIIHSELDAVSKCRDILGLRGSTIYVTLFPCRECAKIIIAFGIKKVVYGEYRIGKETDMTKRLLEECGVEFEHSDKLLVPKPPIRITLPKTVLQPQVIEPEKQENAGSVTETPKVLKLNFKKGV